MTGPPSHRGSSNSLFDQLLLQLADAHAREVAALRRESAELLRRVQATAETLPSNIACSTPLGSSLQTSTSPLPPLPPPPQWPSLGATPELTPTSHAGSDACLALDNVRGSRGGGGGSGGGGGYGEHLQPRRAGLPGEVHEEEEEEEYRSIATPSTSVCVSHTYANGTFSNGTANFADMDGIGPSTLRHAHSMVEADIGKEMRANKTVGAVGVLARSCNTAVALRCCVQVWHNYVVKMKTCMTFTLRKCLANPDLDKAARQDASGTDTVSVTIPAASSSMEERVISTNHCCRYFLLNPSRSLRLTWDLAGSLLLGWDVIMIPMMVFPLPREGLITVMDWVTLLFWTMDMVMSCITGVTERGITVMDPAVIIRRYVRTWFLLDLVVVGPDWIFTFIDALGGESSSAAESGKLLRTLRIMRTARLLRLAKLQRILSLLRDHIDSELMFIVTSILKLLLLLMMLNHFLAATWYAIGTLGKDLGYPNWIESQFFDRRSVPYRYATSLHWSICMFTPGSMSVQPENTGERVFAVCVLLFGLIIFSSFISSMTAAVTQLKNMQGSRAKDLWLLRRYLRQYHVDQELTYRILRYVDYVFHTQKDTLAENKVTVLRLLSEQMYNELKYQVSFSAVKAHPFLELLGRQHLVSMNRLVGAAFKPHTMASMDWLFSAGVSATHMFVIESGGLHYVRSEEVFQPQKDDWLCEASLWTHWVNRGDARAITECKLIQVDAARFLEVVTLDTMSLMLASQYAQKYVEWLCHTPRGALTDVSYHSTMRLKVLDFLEEDSIDGKWRFGSKERRLISKEKDTNMMAKWGSWGRKSVCRS